MQGPVQARSLPAPPSTAITPDAQMLRTLVEYRMPVGKYKGIRLIRLPEAYLAWFSRKGMPGGQLGQLLETALVVRSSGLEYLFEPLIAQAEREGR